MKGKIATPTKEGISEGISGVFQGCFRGVSGGFGQGMANVTDPKGQKWQVASSK